MRADALLMAGLAMTSVGLWTLRVAIAARGRKLAGAVVAAVEAVVFALTFSHLVTDLGSPDRLLGYAAGVAAGTALGLLADDRMSPGHTELHVIAKGYSPDLVATLHGRGWPATWSSAEGPQGPVTQVWVTVDDSRVPELVSDVDRVAPESFWTLRRLQGARASDLPGGCRQIQTRRAHRSSARPSVGG